MSSIEVHKRKSRRDNLSTSSRGSVVPETVAEPYHIKETKTDFNNTQNKFSDTCTSPMNMSANLQRQFQEITKNQETIQKRYKELWSWHGSVCETSQFLDYQMEGVLRKFVEKVKLF